MAIASAKVECLAKPNGATAPSLTVDAATDTKKAAIAVQGSDFATKGTYTYKLTLKNGDKELTRTFTVNVVDTATVQAYQLSVGKTEVDTTVKSDTADAAGYAFDIKVVEMANGAAIGDLDSAIAVEYTVRDKDGKTVDIKADNGLSVASGVLTVSPVSATGTNFKKVLGVGTYYVTAKFKVGTKDVAVSGSFTVKDSQDTAVNVNVKKNDLGNTMTVTAAFADKNFVVVSYDGNEQTISSADINKVNGTIAGNTAYVTSVELYITLTNSSNKVLITVPVNQTFTNVTGL